MLEPLVLLMSRFGACSARTSGDRHTHTQTDTQTKYRNPRCACAPRVNEELGRHRGREGRKECLLCDDECESVSHVLWDCPVCNTLRNDFLCKLQELLGDGFEHFEGLDSFEKASFVFGSELWGMT